jgi:hypothetical protein
MDEVLSSIPNGVQNEELENEENLGEVVGEFFGIVGGARLEENVRLDLHLPTGDIIARHEDMDKIARLTFDGGLSATEIDFDEFSDLREDLENISRPSTPNVVHD